MNDFTADDLIECYRRGVFPMGEARDDPRIFIVEPHRRGVIIPREFHVPARLARTVRADKFEITIDQDFDAVVAACAEVPGRNDTWINAPIQRLYGELFRRGQAHSVEARLDGRLVGGLYGVSLERAFFGESMFSTERDASKVCLVHLVARLIRGGYVLLDCQFQTDHLAQFGTREISQDQYKGMVSVALGAAGALGSGRGAGAGSGAGTTGAAGAAEGGATTGASTLAFGAGESGEVESLGSILGSGEVTGAWIWTGEATGPSALQAISQAS